jgi:hypothetical protein
MVRVETQRLRKMLRDFDIYQGGRQPARGQQHVPNMQSSALGKINLMFEPVVNNATVSGIEILDESK